MVKVLMIGDIVGKPGRSALQALLPRLKEELEPDLVIANGENAAGGAGITEKVFLELQSSGIDIITGGNHSWDQKDIFNFIDRQPHLLRPANYPEVTTPGSGSLVCNLENRGQQVAVINLIGRIFMSTVDCPFQVADRELARLDKNIKVIIVDFHAEATSEKQALGWYLDGRVSALLGTHSHVQTADERLLKKGTGYISDVGMTGLYDSILGVDIEGPLQRFISRLPCRLHISSGKTMFNAVLVEINERTGNAERIERIYQIN